MVASGSQINKNAGDKLHINVQFAYQGPGDWTGDLYVNLYGKTLGIKNEVNGAEMRFPITVTARADTPVVQQVPTVDYTIPNRPGETLGLTVKITATNGLDALSNIIDLDNVVVIASTTSVITNLTVVSYT